MLFVDRYLEYYERTYLSIGWHARLPYEKVQSRNYVRSVPFFIAAVDKPVQRL